jgi:SPP1 family predicted phage head-tail adaptor
MAVVLVTYDNELTLIQQSYGEDEVGNQIPVENEVVILCNKKSVGRMEFYNAAQNGLNPEFIFAAHGYEYNGENLVEFEGKRYKVIKTYQVDFETIELTCERKVGSG